MKPGRKRRPRPVTLPGKVTLADIERAEKAQRMAETATVLAQPHRRGFAGTEAESALGRFCLRHTPGNRLLIDAGEAWARLKRQYRRAWGINTENAPGEPGSHAHELTMEAAQKMGAQIDRIEAKLSRPMSVLFAINRLVIEDRDIAGQPTTGDALIGLRILAVELCGMKPDHPFHGGRA